MQSLDRGLVENAGAIRLAAEHLRLEASNHWTPQSTERLSRLTETLVSDLLPSLAAAESVLSPHLERDLGNLLRDANQQIRLLAERMSTVSEAVSRSRTPSRTRSVGDALLALEKSLHEVESVDREARRRIEASRSESELAELAELLEAASVRAREHIVLVAQPEPAPTDAYVLRKRPDLDRAYATNLDALERARPRSRLRGI